MNRIFRRLQYLLHLRRHDRELAEEMEFHREMTVRHGGAGFGSALRLREEARDAWGWTWIDRLLQDVRYAARLLRRSPGFTIAAVSMLAVGIGANVAVFGFFDLMFFRPLDVREPATLLRFHRHSPDKYAYALPFPEMAFFRDHSRTLSAVIGLSQGRVSVEGEEKLIGAHFVTSNFFTELGGAARIGRVFDTKLDEKPGAEPVVVLAPGFWERHFGADPHVVGSTIRLNGKPATVIGVASRDFNGLSFDPPGIWAPLNAQPYFFAGSALLTDMSFESSGVQVWGRLGAQATPRMAEQELTLLAAELHKQYPEDIWRNEALVSEPGGYAKSLRIGNRRGTGSEGADAMYPVFALTSMLVLLILGVACCNLGNLLLARGVARAREIAIRLAVGAGAPRLARQLFTESLLLGLAGAAAGLGVGFVVLRGLLAMAEGPSWLDPTPDWRVALFAVAVGLGAAVFFGLMPAIQTARQRVRATLVRQILVGAQIAASCVLLIVAGLLGRALRHAISDNHGFEYQKVISIDAGLARHGYSPEKARAYLTLFESRLRALPGVESVSLALSPPLGRVSVAAQVNIDGREASIQLNRVTPEYFSTMKIPLLLGRNLSAGDKQAMVVSESLAHRLWPGKNPLGKGLEMGGNYTVVGISANARTVKPEDSDLTEAYFPIEKSDLPSLFLLARTAGRPEDTIRAISAIAHSIESSTAPEIVLLKNEFRRKVKNVEYGVLSVSALGLIAHLLACMGVLGLMAYAVSQRTKEIGIRMALGAKPRDVVFAVASQFLPAVATGMLLGIGAAVGISHMLRGMLYGISNLDPMTYFAAVAIFLATVTLAALFPARRALSIDPLRALRYD